MKAKLVKRILLGFPLGVFICTTITMLISLGAAEGAYWAVVPQLSNQMGSEIGAFVLQYFLSGILGAACSAGSIVWEMENWSLLKQTVIHYLIIAGSMFPIAWFSWWMPHSVLGALLYIGIFLVVYGILFIVMYAYWKNKIQKMNDCIQRGKGNIGL